MTRPLHWSPSEQKLINADIDRRLGSLEVQLSEVRETAEQTALLAATLAKNIAKLLEALGQQP